MKPIDRVRQGVSIRTRAVGVAMPVVALLLASACSSSNGSDATGDSYCSRLSSKVAATYTGKDGFTGELTYRKAARGERFAIVTCEARSAKAAPGGGTLTATVQLFVYADSDDAARGYRSDDFGYDQGSPVADVGDEALVVTERNQASGVEGISYLTVRTGRVVAQVSAGEKNDIDIYSSTAARSDILALAREAVVELGGVTLPTEPPSGFTTGSSARTDQSGMATSDDFAGYCTGIDAASTVTMLGSATPFAGEAIAGTVYTAEVRCIAKAGARSVTAHVYRYPSEQSATSAETAFGGTTLAGIGDDARFLAANGSLQVRAGADLIRVDTTGGPAATATELTPIAKAAVNALPG